MLTGCLADLLAAEPDVIAPGTPPDLAEPMLTGAVDHAFAPLPRDPHRIGN